MRMYSIKKLTRKIKLNFMLIEVDVMPYLLWDKVESTK
jgi:hypothetical protein